MAFAENLRWLMQQRGVSSKDLADALSVKVNTISNYVTGVSAPKFDALERIVKVLDISADIILFSNLPEDGLPQKKGNPISEQKGNLNGNLTTIYLTENADSDAWKDHIGKNNNNIFVSPHHGEPAPPIITVNDTGEENILLVPFKAAAGYLTGYSDEHYIGHLPSYKIPGFDAGTHRAFEVTGNSMLPTLYSTDIVIAKFQYLSQIIDDEIYVIVTLNDGITIKRVINRLGADNTLVLKSDNYVKVDYPDLVMKPDQIIEVWHVRAKLSQQLPKPGEMFHKEIDFERRLTLIEQQLKGY